MLELFDTHCHFDFPVFDPDRDDLLADAAKVGVKKILIPGVSRETWPRLYQLARKHRTLVPAYGLHPYFLSEHKQQDIDQLADWARRPECVAVGECGLDWAMAQPDKARQIALFEGQLELAKSLQKPIILHVRKAHPEVLQRLKQSRPEAGGVVHAFSGSLGLAEDYIRRGFKLGIGGVITYPRAHRTRETVSRLPLTSMLLETDAPDMPLSGEQGRRNTPQRVAWVFRQLCQLRTEPPAQIAAKIWDNSCRLFGSN
jgi:TatD DNase family protein